MTAKVSRADARALAALAQIALPPEVAGDVIALARLLERQSRGTGRASKPAAKPSVRRQITAEDCMGPCEYCRESGKLKGPGWCKPCHHCNGTGRRQVAAAYVAGGMRGEFARQLPEGRPMLTAYRATMHTRGWIGYAQVGPDRPEVQAVTDRWRRADAADVQAIVEGRAKATMRRDGPDFIRGRRLLGSRRERGIIRPGKTRVTMDDRARRLNGQAGRQAASVTRSAGRFGRMSPSAILAELYALAR